MIGPLAASPPKGDPAQILGTLLEPPWLYVVLAVGVCFGLWLLYLFLPGLIRLSILVANLLFRRGDSRALGRTLTLGLVVMAVLAAGGVVYARLPPEVQYSANTGFYLILIIVVVLLVVAFITWLTLGAFHFLGGPILSRRYERFIGWHFLKSHRRKTPLMRSYDGGTRPALWLPLTLAAVFVAMALLLPKVPWSIVLGHSERFVPVVVTGSWVMAALFLLWPLRRVRPTGTIDVLDRVELWSRGLPNVLTVTVTTFVSIVGVGVGIWALVVVLSVMAGFEQDLRGKILSTNPHVVVQDVEPMEGIPDVDGLIDQFQAIPGVASVVPYVQGDVIVTSRDNRNIAMTLRGVDPADLARAEHHLMTSVVTGSLENLSAPERLLSTSQWLGLGPASRQDRHMVAHPMAPALDDPLAPTPIPGVEVEKDLGAADDVRPGLLLGRELATNLRVSVGSEVTVISPRDDAGFLGIQPRARTFRVAGIFATGMYEFDLKLGYALLSESQRFFQLGNDITKLELRLLDVDKSDEVLAAVRPMVAEAKSLETLDWKGLNKNLFSALMLEKIVMFVVLGFITLVASLNVLGSLVMIILDKTREIAVLKAMGATNGAVTRMFLVLGTTIGMIGSTAGFLVGLLTCIGITRFGIQLPKQYYIDRLPVHMDFTTISVVIAAGIGLCTLATLYPAWQAATVDPVEGLRGE